MTKKILIIDDEPTILSGLSKAIYKFCDFQGVVKTVENSRKALREITHCFYDICFLDINLPDFNGIDVMKKIKELSPETRVVIMTAQSITDDMKRAIDELASLFITKPFNLSQIKVFVNHVLEDSREGFGRERRQFERRPFMKTINYSIGVYHQWELRANALDISDAGIGIQADYPLECGHMLWFTEGIKHRAGIVRWSTMVSETSSQAEKDNYRVGIQFI
jgi:YesN/AraC family two-component response regulator